jgi:hypothetical protein
MSLIVHELTCIQVVYRGYLYLLVETTNKEMYILHLNCYLNVLVIFSLWTVVLRVNIMGKKGI